MTDRLYWPSWFLAALLTGMVGGFMLGHALILAQFLNWLLVSGVPALSAAYPTFRGSAGRAGLDAYYAVAGLQVIGTSAFLLVSLAARRHRTAALVAGIAGVLWIAIHYVSGFGALEASVLGSAGPVDQAVAGRFVGWSVPIHVVHAVILAVALGALLSVPLTALRRRG
jgi:glucan phosphoethanolaminetransferase (alkaline phosphatase superfamily)